MMNYFTYYKKLLNEGSKDPELINTPDPNSKISLMLYWFKTPGLKMASIVPVITQATDSQKMQAVAPNKPGTLKWWAFSENLISLALKKNPRYINVYVNTLAKTIVSKSSLTFCWILPYSPLLENAISKVRVLTKNKYLSLSTKGDLGLSKLAFLLLFRRGLTTEDLLKMITTQTLEKTLTKFNSSKKVTDIFSELVESISIHSIKNDNELKSVIEQINEFFTPEDKNVDLELLFVELFCNHLPSMKINSKETTDETSEDSEVIPDESDQETNSESPVVPKKKDLNSFIKEDFLNSPEIVIADKKSISSRDFKIISTLQLESLIKEEDDFRQYLENYTSDDFQDINRFLGTEYLKNVFFNELDLFNENFSENQISEINLSEKFKSFFQGIFKYHETIIAEIETLNYLLNESKLPKDILSFRGLPTKSSFLRGEFKSDIWLRKTILDHNGNDISLKIDGTFQNIMYKNVIEEKINTLDDFYNVGKIIHSKTLLSTSISKKIADGFGSANFKYGHLLIIKSSKNSAGLYIDKYSLSQGELELLLPINSPLKLERVEFRSNIDLDNILGVSDNGTQQTDKFSADRDSLVFFFTYDDPENISSELNEEKIKKDIIFWKNVEKIFNKITWVEKINDSNF